MIKCVAPGLLALAPFTHAQTYPTGVTGYEASGWFGVLVPAGTPHPAIERLNAAIVKA